MKKLTNRSNKIVRIGDITLSPKETKNCEINERFLGKLKSLESLNIIKVYDTDEVKIEVKKEIVTPKKSNRKKSSK